MYGLGFSLTGRGFVRSGTKRDQNDLWGGLLQLEFVDDWEEVGVSFIWIGGGGRSGLALELYMDLEFAMRFVGRYYSVFDN